MIVYHFTGTATKEAAIENFNRTTGRRSSMHYVIDTNGSLTQLVAESKKAWHVGPVSHYLEYSQINDISIGIALVNPGRLIERGGNLYTVPDPESSEKEIEYWSPENPSNKHTKDSSGEYWAQFTDAQITAAKDLTTSLNSKYGTLTENGALVLARHSDIQEPQTKGDTAAGHTNSGNCPRCDELMDFYPGFYDPLRKWFKQFQAAHPEGHVISAGRSESEQNGLVGSGGSYTAGSKPFPSSAHNWGAALDIFQQGSMDKDTWFRTVLAPTVPSWCTWGGNYRSYDPVHVQVGNLTELRNSGKVTKVLSPTPGYRKALDPGPAFPIDTMAEAIL